MGFKDKTDENAVAEWGEEQREPFKNNHQKALGEMWVGVNSTSRVKGSVPSI